MDQSNERQWENFPQDGTGLVVWNTPLHKTMAAVRDL